MNIEKISSKWQEGITVRKGPKMLPLLLNISKYFNQYMLLEEHFKHYQLKHDLR
ncbi:hypothetical protein J2S21_002224 [Peribacillus cavernae]|nr:hypothetical protein [Peribacillus cavernae]